MPTNANTFNSRVTSEALEAKFRAVFPAQGGAELVQDLFASGVIQPVVDFSSVAEGSILPEFLQTAWDFSTGSTQRSGNSATIINNTGFWRISVKVTQAGNSGTSQDARIQITDGITTKTVWRSDLQASGSASSSLTDDFVVFVRAGESVTATSSNADTFLDATWRQIADVNGNLVNPLGFTFS